MTQQQWHAAREMPVLCSFAHWGSVHERYWPSASELMIDSGAFSEINTGVAVDIDAYKGFVMTFAPQGIPCAGLDDIGGDGARSMRNYQHAGGFPTIHDADDQGDGFLSELVAYAQEWGQGWIGVGMTPGIRGRLGPWVREVTERIKALDPTLHIHGWAARAHYNSPDGRLLDSTDSTNWLLDRQKVMAAPETRHLTPAEALDIVVLRYKRERRRTFTEEQGTFL